LIIVKPNLKTQNTKTQDKNFKYKGVSVTKLKLFSS